MYETHTFEDPLVLDPAIRARWTFLETSSAAAVLRAVCPYEWYEITNVLANFSLVPNQWLKSGGNRGEIAREIDGMFSTFGWRQTREDLFTQGVLYSENNEELGRLPPMQQVGYVVDNFKGRVAVDVEWNAKDGNLDRDLSAYRAWHEAGVISAAVIITQDRLALKALAERLWSDYQQTLPADQRNPKLPIDLSTSTTTNLDKAALRVQRGGDGDMPSARRSSHPSHVEWTALLSLKQIECLWIAPPGTHRCPRSIQQRANALNGVTRFIRKLANAQPGFIAFT